MELSTDRVVVRIKRDKECKNLLSFTHSIRISYFNTVAKEFFLEFLAARCGHVTKFILIGYEQKRVEIDFENLLSGVSQHVSCAFSMNCTWNVLMVVGTPSGTIVPGDSRAECCHSSCNPSTQGLLIRAILLGLCYLQVFINNKSP